MLDDFHELAHDDVADLRAAVLIALHRRAAADHAADEFLDRQVDLDIFFKPRKRYEHRLHPPFSELRQETQVIFKQQTHIGHVVLEVGDALDADAEGKSRCRRPDRCRTSPAHGD